MILRSVSTFCRPSRSSTTNQPLACMASTSMLAAPWVTAVEGAGRGRFVLPGLVAKTVHRSHQRAFRARQRQQVLVGGGAWGQRGRMLVGRQGLANAAALK